MKLLQGHEQMMETHHTQAKQQDLPVPGFALIMVCNLLMKGPIQLGQLKHCSILHNRVAEVMFLVLGNVQHQHVADIADYHRHLMHSAWDGPIAA